MGWVVQPHPSGGYTVVNRVTRQSPGPTGATRPRFATKTAALAAVAAINAAYKQKPEAQRRRLEAATQAAATRRRNRQPSRRRRR